MIKDLFLEDGTKAGLLDVCDWWCSVYPDDIFETGPYLIVEIRERMKKLLMILRPDVKEACVPRGGKR